MFLVIQHADIQVQDKYLPMMREAVAAGKAQGSSLAMLEDRVAMRHCNKQIYGSQVINDPAGKYLCPVTDPDNLDKRRASVGLEPIADYLIKFGMKWDLEQYKRDLPELEKKQKKLNGCDGH